MKTDMFQAWLVSVWSVIALGCSGGSAEGVAAAPTDRPDLVVLASEPPAAPVRYDSANGVSSAKAREATPTKESADVTRHLPTTCEVAVRIAVREVAASPLVQRELAPAIDAYLAADSGPESMAAFLKDASIDWRTSIQELGFCGKNEDVAFVFAGDLREGTVLPAIRRQGLVPFELHGVQALRSRPGIVVPVFVAQLEDGVVVTATNEALFAELIPSGSQRQDLEPNHDFSFSVTQTGFRRFIKRDDVSGELDAVTALVGAFDLERQKATLRYATGSGDAAQKLAHYVMRHTEKFRSPIGAPPDEVEVHIEGADVIAVASYGAAPFEIAAKALAGKLASAH